MPALRPPALNTALSCAGDEATVVEMSWYGEGQVPVATRRRLFTAAATADFEPSGEGRIEPAQPLELPRAVCRSVGLAARPALDVLLEPACPFEDLPARLPAILAPGSGVLCQLVSY